MTRPPCPTILPALVIESVGYIRHEQACGMPQPCWFHKEGEE